MPVKVGEADTLDATEPDFAPRLAKAITEAEQEGARHVELKLAPEHLGKLSVELTQGKDGVLHIVFHAENEQAMKLLQEHSAAARSRWRCPGPSRESSPGSSRSSSPDSSTAATHRNRDGSARVQRTSCSSFGWACWA